jgi:DNA-binding response OmpR family regulator
VSSPCARIVLISDDEQLRSLLCGLLIAHGHREAVGSDVRTALAPHGRADPWDVAVVDTSVSYEHALRALRQLKKNGTATVAIIAKQSSAAAPHDLPDCSDVVLRKPFDPRELLLVIRGMLDDGADAASPDETTISSGPITLSAQLNHATVAARELELTGVETRILYELLLDAGNPVGRERLMRRALLRERSDTRALDRHINSLRNKLGGDRRGRTPIRTVRSVGYLLLADWEPKS